MTQSAFVTASVWSYGVALVGYVGFAFWAGVGSRASLRARLLLLMLVLTAVWAALGMAIAIAPSPAVFAADRIAEALRYGAWYLFLWHLLARSDVSARPARIPWAAFGVVTAVLVGRALLGEAPNGGQFVDSAGYRLQYLLSLALAVFGLMQVEQVLRRVHPQMRWGIKPLAVALVGIFGFDLFFYADAMLFGGLDQDIWVARAVANVVVIPLIAMATARSTGWTIDLHVSRRVVFQSSALLLSGVFLLAVAAAGYFVRYSGGDWARALQIELLFTAALVVVLVISSGRFRAWLKVYVSKHFFSYRFDYREEWLRFTRTLSIESATQTLAVRTIVALADLVESPGGLLFLHEESRGFVPSARWNVPACDIVEPSDGVLPAFLRRTGWIVSVAEYRAQPSRYADLLLPDWIGSLASPWLLVPLISGTELLGFVALSAPRASVEIDWEVRDLLKTASRQAASYLGQVRATEALLEARKFEAFNRMSAFVVHDLKNLVSQLSLMQKNAQRHRDNPAFQSDMLSTVAHVVERMNALMLQLRVGTEPVESPRHVDLDAVLRRVCATKADPRIPIDLRSSGPLDILGHEDRLEHVIGHLVQNAIDASPQGARIDVRVEADGPFANLVVIDHGVGMRPEFVRERLFKPFQSTKPAGMGIGVYESQQYVASIGGEIRIQSAPESGTRVEVKLCVAKPISAAGIAPHKEQVA